MSSLKRTANQCARDNAPMRRYALVPNPNAKSVKSLPYGNSVSLGSPLRLRSKGELRSISFEGSNRVLPWTIRLVFTFLIELNIYFFFFFYIKIRVPEDRNVFDAIKVKIIYVILGQK